MIHQREIVEVPYQFDCNDFIRQPYYDKVINKVINSVFDIEIE